MTRVCSLSHTFRHWDITVSQVYAVYNRKNTLIYSLAGLRLLTTAATIVIEVFYLPAGGYPRQRHSPRSLIVVLQARHYLPFTT
jgi:hypothetical protein